MQIGIIRNRNRGRIVHKFLTKTMKCLNVYRAKYGIKCVCRVQIFFFFNIKSRYEPICKIPLTLFLTIKKSLLNYHLSKEYEIKIQIFLFLFMQLKYRYFCFLFIRVFCSNFKSQKYIDVCLICM